MSDSGLGVIVAGAVASLGGVGRGSRLQRAIGPIVAAVTIEEKHTDTVEITDHPIEQGATISDHAFQRPPELTLRVAWSNSPGGAAGLYGGVADYLTSVVQGQVGNLGSKAINGAIGNSPVGNIVGQAVIGAGVASFTQALNTGTGKGTSAVQDIYQQLLKLQISVTPFTIYTGKRKYDNMLIKTMTVETDRTTENSLVATLNCRQVMIVSTSVLAVSASPLDQASPQATNPTSDLGTKQTVPVDPAANAGLRAELDAVGLARRDQ